MQACSMKSIYSKIRQVTSCTQLEINDYGLKKTTGKKHFLTLT